MNRRISFETAVDPRGTKRSAHQVRPAVTERADHSLISTTRTDVVGEGSPYVAEADPFLFEAQIGPDALIA